MGAISLVTGEVRPLLHAYGRGSFCSRGFGGAIGCPGRRRPADGISVTTCGRSLVASVDSISRRAFWSPRDTMGPEKTRLAGSSQTGQATQPGAVPMGRLTSVGPSSSQKYW